MTGAALGDRFGRRRIFMAGLGCSPSASALCALAPGIGWLIAARSVQGCGAGARYCRWLWRCQRGVPADRRGLGARHLQRCDRYRGGGGAAGRGAVTQDLAWQWIFWLNVPLGAIGFR